MTELRRVRQIEELLSYVPFLFLILWSVQALIGMVTENIYGSYPLFFVNFVTGKLRMGRSVRGFTVLESAFCYLIVFYLLGRLRPILRHFCSTVFTMLGLFFYEFWWHLGLWVVDRSGEGMFWGVGTLLYFVFVYYVDMYLKILDLGVKSLVVVVLFFTLFIILWVAVIREGFYGQYFLFIEGSVKDPHGICIALDKLIGIVMWTAILKSPRKNSPGGRRSELT